VFCLWLLGAATPLVGRIVDRVGWRPMGAVAVALCASGSLLTLPAHISTLAVGLAVFALGNFSGVTAAQIGVATSTQVDRGAASAVYFSCYYAFGSLGAYLPGLAWQSWGWSGVVGLVLGSMTIAAAALAVKLPGRLAA
jgi:MFS transporter, YNFM family, putative membrane transport protein